MGINMSTRIQAIVLIGERFSKTIIRATGIAVAKKISEKICQNVFKPSIIFHRL
jgi:hypothetical protein